MVLAATCQAAQFAKAELRGRQGCPPVVLMRKREERAVVLHRGSRSKN
jgi:hypothetical protein